jgi:hypothetical protein
VIEPENPTTHKFDTTEDMGTIVVGYTILEITFSVPTWSISSNPKFRSSNPIALVMNVSCDG